MGRVQDQQETSKKKLTQQAVLSKIYRYCSYQERSHKEVKSKLYLLGLSSAQVDELLSQLITEGFLNEERFAKSFAGGKFRMKKWGKLKIVNELERKGLTKNCIKIGLKEIEKDDYLKALRQLIKQKIQQSKDDNLFAKRDKIARAVILKGYEPDLVWTEVKEQLPD